MIRTELLLVMYLRRFSFAPRTFYLGLEALYQLTYKESNKSHNIVIDAIIRQMRQKTIKIPVGCFQDVGNV